MSSLILVQFIGLRGVLIGTGLAGLYRTTDSIIYTNKYVLERSSYTELRMVGINFFLYFMIAFAAYRLIVLNCSGYTELLLAAITVGIIVVAIFGIVFYWLNRNEAKVLLRAFKKKA